MRFQGRVQLMQAWIAVYESLAKQSGYHMLCLQIDIPGPKPITGIWKMFLLAWISFRYSMYSSLRFTTWCRVNFTPLFQTGEELIKCGHLISRHDPKIIGILHRWQPWANHDTLLIVHFNFIYRLDLEIFKGEFKVFCNKYDKNVRNVRNMTKPSHLNMKNMRKYWCLYMCS